MTKEEKRKTKVYEISICGDIEGIELTKFITHLELGGYSTHINSIYKKIEVFK